MKSSSKLVFVFLFTVLAGSVATAQDRRFDLKGHSVLIDVGVQVLGDEVPVGAENVGIQTWGSRTVSVSYFRRINISPLFAINPGIAIGIDKFSWKDGHQISQSFGQSDLSGLGLFADSDPQFAGHELDIRKSFLSNTYVDIPFELSFQTTQDKKPFRFAFGGKFGLLVKSMAKTKFKVDGESHTRTFKTTGNYGLNPIRYGLTARAGYGPINFFGYYSLSNLFRENDDNTEGLVTTDADNTPANFNANPLSFGLTINLGR
jgi:hypothetical protein